MYDILPSGPSNSGHKSARPLRPQTGKRSERKVVYSGPRVVQMDWKLPARLRKPIREQLAKERSQRRRQAAAVKFSRRPLHTQPVLEANRDSKTPGAHVRKPRRLFNRGSEHHTRDMHTYSKPQLQVAAPPYVGSAARSFASVTKPQPAASVVKRQKAVSSRPAAQKRTQRPTMFAERDVPMQWSAGAGHSVEVNEDVHDDLFVQVEKPRRVASGLTFSLWPGNWFGGRKNAAMQNVVSTSRQDHKELPVGARSKKKLN